MELADTAMRSIQARPEHANRQLWDACVDFEALLLNSLLSLEGGFERLTGGTSALGQYAGLAMPRVAEELAQRSPLGLAELLYSRLERSTASKEVAQEA